MHPGRTLLYVGLALVAAGLLWMLAAKLGLGRLPGDVVVKKKNFTLYIPIVTSLVISLVLTLLINLFRK